VFESSEKVGENGFIVGVDFSADMIKLANIKSNELNLKNVEFVQGNLVNLPIEDKFADLVISNCVINLVPNKQKAFAEAFRILKSGGRFVISDIVAKKEIPDEVKSNMDNFRGCLGGTTKQSYRGMMQETGFSEIQIMNENEFTNEVGEYSIQYESALFLGIKP
jgi:ubiquinone/menaquinone biosynthesis C-methylase UbiE